MRILSNNQFCTHLAITFDEDGVEPSEKYLEEVREYFQQQLPRDSLNREARQASRGKLSVNLWNICMHTESSLQMQSTMER
jgi:hypothetical protein